MTAFNGHCDDLKIIVTETRKTLGVLDGKYGDGIFWMAEPVTSAGYDSIKTYLDDLSSHNDNIQVVLDSGISSPNEEAVLKSLLLDFDKNDLLSNMVVDSKIWAEKTHEDLDSVGKICGF